MSINLKDKVYILDGAMGTMLQRSGMEAGKNSTEYALKHPEILKDIHSQYVNAGSDIIYAPTFSVNRKVAEELGESLESAVEKLMAPALEVKKEAAKAGREVFVGLDMGSQGELLEPMGKRTFEEAYDIYADIVKVGAANGADLVVIETMIDLYEAKAALLAAKENSELPVIVSLSFEENGRTFTGSSIEALAVTMEGLGADAIGINCSLGPEQILPLTERLMRNTNLPVFAKPNAGLPDPSTGGYDIDAPEFAATMKKYIEAGTSMVGGCCGTDSEYIRGTTANRDAVGKRPAPAKELAGIPRVCSSSKVVDIDHVAVIGERLNPTGKKKMQQAMIEGDFDYIMSKAVEQIEAGAEILDVNVGVPGLDEVKALPALVKKLQSITNLPLQIDSSNAKAIEAALRVYNGKAIVNSVNGKDEILDEILPVVKKYGACVIGLTLDENGIPPTCEERFAIAEKILDRAISYGIPKEDVIIDCLTLTASAQQKEVGETLKTVRRVKEELGLRTALGVSNVSFGLPLRPVINRTFLIMALENGLDLPIINPNDEDMMASVYAFNLLKNKDENGSAYISRYANVATLKSALKLNPGKVMTSAVDKGSATAKSSGTGGSAADDFGGSDIIRSVVQGLEAETADAVKKLLETKGAIEIVNEDLIPALDKVGKDFEAGKLFLPEMLQSAQAAQVGFDVIKKAMEENNITREPIGKVVIATVKGDIHDIGKNIVRVIMENYGFEMIDLGKDVSIEAVVEAVKENDIKLVGLSALMTTTLASMEETIKAVKKAAPDCKVMVGGAVLTADYAEEIGADYYCKDAMKSVEAAQEVFA